jgi:p-cumate 2,3-dioxygenase subunit alpha
VRFLCRQLIGVPGEEAYGSGWYRAERALRAAPRTESYRGFYLVNFSHEGEDLVTHLDVLPPHGTVSVIL